MYGTAFCFQRLTEIAATVANRMSADSDCGAAGSLANVAQIFPRYGIAFENIDYNVFFN
jgi:hypothetical protein